MPTSSSRIGPLQRVPLWIRQTVVCLSFYALALGALPLAAVRIDAVLPFGPLVLPTWLRLGGWLLLGVVVVTYLLCSIWLMSRGRGSYVEFDPPREFVSSGPYRWCRNPVAACVVAMIAAEAVALSSATLLVGFLAAIPIAQAQVVLLEEPLLRKRFGASYENYRQRVPRWLPRRPR